MKYEHPLKIYQDVHDNGSKAPNSTGLIPALWRLQKYLMANEASIMPQEFTTINTYYIKELFPLRSSMTDMWAFADRNR